MLDRLDLNQTRQVVQALLAEHPRLIDDLDRQVTLITAASFSPLSKTTRRTPVDSAPFRRQVRQIFRGAVNAWENGDDDDPITENLLDIVAKAKVAYQQAGQQAEWSAYHRQLIQTHARKYKLMAML